MNGKRKLLFDENHKNKEQKNSKYVKESGRPDSSAPNSDDNIFHLMLD